MVATLAAFFFRALTLSRLRFNASISPARTGRTVRPAPPCTAPPGSGVAAVNGVDPVETEHGPCPAQVAPVYRQLHVFPVVVTAQVEAGAAEPDGVLPDLVAKQTARRAVFVARDDEPAREVAEP